MNTIKQLVPQTHKPVIAGAVLTTCFLLFFVCNTVYKKYQSHHFSMVGQKEISHNYAVPKFLVLRPAGQDLKPALFAAQMGNEGIFNPEKLFVNSLKYDSRNVTALKSLGMIHLFKREYDKAEGYYVRALELTDDKADILNDLAVLQFEYSNEREAYALLKNATKRVPDKIEVIYNLALVCRVLNKPGEAKFWEKKFKSLNNSDEWEQMFKEKLKNLIHHKVEHN